MNKFTLIAAAAMFAAGIGVPDNANAQAWRYSESTTRRDNSLAMSFSATGFFGNNARTFGSVAFEFDHRVWRNLSVSAVALYAPICEPGNLAGSYPTAGRFLFAGAKGNYNIPVVRGWLWFRVGAGTGIGVQHRNESFDRETADREGNPMPPSSPTRIYPHLMVDAWWVLRVGPGFDLRFAPLLVSPSQYIFGMGSNLHRHGDTPFEFSNLFTIGAAVRF